MHACVAAGVSSRSGQEARCRPLCLRHAHRHACWLAASRSNFHPACSLPCSPLSVKPANSLHREAPAPMDSKTKQPPYPPPGAAAPPARPTSRPRGRRSPSPSGPATLQPRAPPWAGTSERGTRGNRSVSAGFLWLDRCKALQGKKERRVRRVGAETPGLLAAAGLHLAGWHAGAQGMWPSGTRGRRSGLVGAPAGRAVSRAHDAPTESAPGKNPSPPPPPLPPFLARQARHGVPLQSAGCQPSEPVGPVWGAVLDHRHHPPEVRRRRWWCWCCCCCCCCCRCCCCLLVLLLLLAAAAAAAAAACCCCCCCCCRRCRCCCCLSLLLLLPLLLLLLLLPHRSKVRLLFVSWSWHGLSGEGAQYG